MTCEPNKRGESAIELETLKGDVAKLANDLKDVLHAVGAQGKEKLEENKKRLESAIKTLRGEAKEKLGEAYDSLHEHSKEAVELSRKKIEERPLTAVFTALGSGIAGWHSDWAEELMSLLTDIVCTAGNLLQSVVKYQTKSLMLKIDEQAKAMECCFRRIYIWCGFLAMSYACSPGGSRADYCRSLYAPCDSNRLRPCGTDSRGHCELAGGHPDGDS